MGLPLSFSLVRTAIEQTTMIDKESHCEETVARITVGMYPPFPALGSQSWLKHGYSFIYDIH